MADAEALAEADAATVALGVMGAEAVPEAIDEDIVSLLTMLVAVTDADPRAAAASFSEVPPEHATSAAPAESAAIAATTQRSRRRPCVVAERCATEALPAKLPAEGSLGGAATLEACRGIDEAMGARISVDARATRPHDGHASEGRTCEAHP